MGVDNDLFGLKDFADRLKDSITRFSPFLKESYVLSINASFGSGKTTFLTMWQKTLKDQGYNALYLNAWKSDMDEDPIMALIECLMEIPDVEITNVKDDEGRTQKFQTLKKNLQLVAGLANGVARIASGGMLDAMKAYRELNEDIETAKDFSDILSAEHEESLESIGAALYQTYHFKKSAYEKIQQTLLAYAESLAQKPLIILVDELDRVRPDYAVKFLETIKHVFSVKDVCFVLAVDKGQLEKSVKQLYGDIVFQEYYRRFVTREFNLPEPAAEQVYKTAMRYLDEYFKKAETYKLNMSFKVSDHEIPELTRFIGDTAHALALTGRQTDDYVRELFHFLVVERTGAPNMSPVLKAKGAALLLAIRIKDFSLYCRLKGHQVNAKELIDYITGFKQSSNDFIIITAIMCNLYTGGEVNNVESAKILGKIRPDLFTGDRTPNQIIAQLGSTLGYSYSYTIRENSYFKQLAEKYEAWEPYA